MGDLCKFSRLKHNSHTILTQFESIITGKSSNSDYLYEDGS